MSTESVLRKRKEWFASICARSSEALEGIDEKNRALEFSIMRAFLSANEQIKMDVPFKKAITPLGPYTRANVDTVIYKLLQKTEPLEDLRNQLRECEKEIGGRSLEESHALLHNPDFEKQSDPKLDAHEILPHLFLGNIEAAKDGTVPSGECRDKSYDLMVKVTTDDVNLKSGIDVIDISVDDSPVGWDPLLSNASGEDGAQEIPVGKWFKMMFDTIAVALLRKKNVLLFCTCGISRSTTVAIAFLMRLFDVRFAQAFAHLKNIRSVVGPNIGFIKSLLEYDALLQYYRRTKFIPQIPSIKSGPMDALRRKFIPWQNIQEYLEKENTTCEKMVPKGEDKVSEFFPQLFWGDTKAARTGTIPYGSHGGEKYGLMVKVSAEPTKFEGNVLDIGVDYSPSWWDAVLKKASGTSFSRETPIEEWFGKTFDTIAANILEGKNVLLFSSTKRDAPLSAVVSAFMLRLHMREYSKNCDYLRCFEPTMDRFDCNLTFKLSNYCTVLRYQIPGFRHPAPKTAAAKKDKPCIML